MRAASWFSLAGCLLVAGCGGGGSQGATSSAALLGIVYQVDGQTVDRSGVRVVVPETGDLVMTPEDGSFVFRDLPAGTVTLVFDSPAALAHGSSEQVDLPSGHTVRVFVAIEDGVVVHMCAFDGDEDRTKASLVAALDSPVSDVEGEVKAESDDDGEELEMEVENLEPGTEVDFLLDNPGDAEGFVLIGTAVADAFGEAELELDTDDGDTLPFGVAGVADLAGFAIEIRLTATGELLLTGEVPDVDEPGFDDGDDEEEEEEDDDDDDDEEEEDDDEGEDEDDEDDD